MTINNHYYDDARRDFNVSTYGTLSPSYVTLHYTMGGSVSGSVSHLNSKGYGYNAIIDRNGDVYQTAPFNKIVRHAGASNWRGWDNLNSFSIGLCFANYGPCYKRGSKFVNSYDGEMEPGSVVAGSHYNGAKKYQSIYWEKYTDEQVSSATQLLKSIIDSYQIRDIVRHDDVAIARKIDTGPALDLTPFHNLIGDRSSEKIYKFQVVTPGDTLNLRKSYSSTSEKIGEFPDGQELYVHSYAYRRYNGRNVKTKWCAVSTNAFDRLGFVSSHHLEAVGHFM